MKSELTKLVWQGELSTLAETDQLARRVAHQMGFGASSGDQIPLQRWCLGLQGEVGSGKTHFVKSLAHALGCDPHQVNSPSYALHQEYSGANLTLHHVDLYRAETPDEIESSGFWDLFFEDRALIVVEWMDRIAENQIPENWIYWRMDWRIEPEGHRFVEWRERTGM